MPHISARVLETPETGFSVRNNDPNVLQSILRRFFPAVIIGKRSSFFSKILRLAEGGVRLILLRCAGFNNVDLQAAKEWGITVLRVPAYSPYAVAEHAIGILMEANRRLHKAHNKVKDNNFALNGLLTYVSREELFEKADLISLYAPLVMGPEGTYHLIDTAAIGRMKDDAMLVNTARGGLIDTEALIEALKDGKFHAVALDVYEGEDANVYTDRSDDYLSDDVTARLQMFPNVVLTSHQAFFTREALQAIAATILENARNFNEGLPLGMAECKV